MNKVPLVKLEPMPDVRARVDTQFIGGNEVRVFERVWAGCTRAATAVGCGNGTDALTLLLRTFADHPLGGRTKVVIPAMSFVATLEAVLNNGLDPVLVDTDAWGNMSLMALDRVMWEHGDDVLAVVPVHLFGRVVDTYRVNAIVSERSSAFIIEDACQAHGARYADGAPVGHRYPAAWSFMPAKILGACGDAGAATFPDWQDMSESFRSRVNHGRAHGHHRHIGPGVNSRLDAVQAAVLNNRLPFLDEYVEGRSIRAHRYTVGLGDVVKVQPDEFGRVWSYYVVRAKDQSERDALELHLSGRDIDTGRHYPYTLANAFERYELPGTYPMAQQLANTGLTLPLWPLMPWKVQDRVMRSVREFYEAGA